MTDSSAGDPPATEPEPQLAGDDARWRALLAHLPDIVTEVDRDGRITFARVSLKGTTLTDKTLWDKCERAVRAARFNAIERAPREQRGLIPFRFKLK